MTSIKEAIAQYGGVIQSENETDSSYDWYYADYHNSSMLIFTYEYATSTSMYRLLVCRRLMSYCTEVSLS